MNVIDSIAANAPSMAALRRDIHAHPELCFEEVRTADLVAKKLTDWGIPVHRGLGTTGVVGIVHGRDGGARKTHFLHKSFTFNQRFLHRVGR